jgi:hypothetical protein
MTLTSRKTSRAALATLLSALTGVGQPAQYCYAYPPRKWEGSPIIYISSTSSQRLRRGIGQTKAFNTFGFDIVVGIAAANLTDAAYTPDVTEGLLDDMEAAISNIVITNPTNAAWAHLTLDEGQPTQIVRLTSDQTGTLPYDIEIISVEVEVYDT